MRDGNFRWFPLGPREAYVPPYQASREYIQKVNLRHVRIDDHETVDAAKVQYAHRNAYRDPPQVFAQVLRQLFNQVREDGDPVVFRPPEAERTEQRKAAVRNEEARRVPEVKRAQKEQKEQKERKLQKVRKRAIGQRPRGVLEGGAACGRINRFNHRTSMSK